ncbi:hypothetical protein QSV08_12830 [Maribacter sp. BPC-D8]|uniref:toxin-antitoxin system YwqK family antitoxin n=1 Tax=Maribacter sp. BPC-D8 TaxID=3053613 RepID=UPI002B49D34A|nr:hypothetical protein [Maribacter sp. BPC-D8]WRI28108.1 hypothetical protein QSV08_12830 [Maribacter sp. BPC-D8]
MKITKSTMQSNYYKTILLLLFMSQVTIAQSLSLSDIENICSKSNWENVNQFLMNKNWEYYESEKGDTDKYSTITWSYNKNYNDAAEAWFYLFTYEGFPSKIRYSVFNKPSYTAIRNSLSAKGYKLKNSEIEDDELISTYTNSKYSLTITTQKREKENDFGADKSITAYDFLLVLKSSIYDPDNGKKIYYYSNGEKKLEYSLVNGKMEGISNVYYENGQLKKTGTYKNNLANGNFIEYNEEGLKLYEYKQLNNKKNGNLIAYEDNKISYTVNFVNGNFHGKNIEYYYTDDTDKLYTKIIGNYINDEKSGLWKTIFIDENNVETVLNKITYENGVKQGFAQEVSGDSLILSRYVNDEYNGKYKIYHDVLRSLLGGVIETDTTKMTLVTKGQFSKGIKNGYWKYYHVTGGLDKEGSYINDNLEGEWKYYHPTYYNKEEDRHEDYSEELYLIETYRNDKLNGISKRYSYLNREEVECSELNAKNQSAETCYKRVYKKVLETRTFKNDELDGPYEKKNASNIVIEKGNYKNGLKEGRFYMRFDEIDENNIMSPYYMEGTFVNDIIEGEWIAYSEKGIIDRTMNFKDGELHGKSTEWYSENKPKKINMFDSGDLEELTVFDNTGNYPEAKFEILHKGFNGYKCRYTKFTASGSESQVYSVNDEEDIDEDDFDLQFFLNIENGKAYKNGDYVVNLPSTEPLIEGLYSEGVEADKWTYYYYSQHVKLQYDYHSSNEKYYTLDDKPYSGDFVLLDDEKGTKEIRSIKDGVRNGKTEIIDNRSGKSIEKVRYKDGIIK